jgi:hypothetical protein
MDVFAAKEGVGGRDKRGHDARLVFGDPQSFTKT